MTAYSTERVSEGSGGLYRCLPDSISPASILLNLIRDQEEQLAVTNRNKAEILTARMKATYAIH